MKREYIFLASWLQYALLRLGNPLVTILAQDAWCCLRCTIFGIGQQEHGAGKIIWYLRWLGKSWRNSLPLLLSRVVPALEKNILTILSEWSIQINWLSLIHCCSCMLCCVDSSDLQQEVSNLKRVQRDAMRPIHKSVYWSCKSHKRCSWHDLGPCVPMEVIAGRVRAQDCPH